MEPQVDLPEHSALKALLVKTKMLKVFLLSHFYFSLTFLFVTLPTVILTGAKTSETCESDVSLSTATS